MAQANGKAVDAEVLRGLSDADWAELERESKNSILQYLKTNDQGLHRRAQIAQAVLSASQRRKATDGARDALNFMIARSLTDDRAQLADYVRVTQPQSPLVRAISEHGLASHSPAEPGTARQGVAEQGKAS